LERTIKDLGKAKVLRRSSKGVHNRKEIKSESAATPSQVPGPVFTKMDAQDASALRLRQTGYGLKDNEII
jgi:hypothetical protein